MTSSLIERVQAVLDRLQPALQADGQSCELVDIDGRTARVRWCGAQSTTGRSTVPDGLKRAIQLEVPEIERVEVTT